jgi:hypothetical protein
MLNDPFECLVALVAKFRRPPPSRRRRNAAGYVPGNSQLPVSKAIRGLATLRHFLRGNHLGIRYLDSGV